MELDGWLPGIGLATAWKRTGDRLEEDGRPPGRGLVAAWKRTGDRLEEDGRPLGIGRVTAWKRMEAITEEAGFRPAVLQKAANRVHPQFKCIVLLYLLLSL